MVVACRPSGPLQLESIQTGKSLNADNSVGHHTTRFKPDDTMFAAVLTDGPGSGSIGARWKYAGRVVSEETREVSYRDHAATVATPCGPWARGTRAPGAGARCEVGAPLACPAPTSRKRG